MVESKKSTKEKAAAARAAAEAEQKKRDRRIQIIGGAVIAVLVAGIIVWLMVYVIMPRYTRALADWLYR